jgi:hypothetical protein
MLSDSEDDMDNSPTATTGQKRAHSPDDENQTQITKAQKIYESHGRPKARDYDDLTQEILAIAIAIYRCLICTDTPFPDHAKELEFVRIAWKKACEQVEVKLQITPELVKMV